MKKKWTDPSTQIRGLNQLFSLSQSKEDQGKEV